MSDSLSSSSTSHSSSCSGSSLRIWSVMFLAPDYANDVCGVELHDGVVVERDL
jgi:hypothetical protein